VPDGLVKTSVTPTQTVKAWREKEADSSINLWNLLEKFTQRGWSWKMCLGYSPQSKEAILRQLSTPWKRTGIWGDGYRVTLCIGAYLTTEIECSLLPVLDQKVSIKSLLTAANCLGILRRENRAGRKLDRPFVKALSETIRLWYNVAVASGKPWREISAPCYAPKLENIKEVIQADQ
jgi:hypothetical protein